jgi:hypothetical protein
MQKDMANRLQISTSQVEVNMTTVPGNDALVNIAVTVRGLSQSYVEGMVGVMSREAGSDGAADLFRETNALLARDGAQPVQLLSAGVDVAPTTPAPSLREQAKEYCYDNMIICVVPACATGMLLIICVVFIYKRRQARRALIESVEHQNWAVTTGAAAPNRFAESPTSAAAGPPGAAARHVPGAAAAAAPPAVASLAHGYSPREMLSTMTNSSPMHASHASVAAVHEEDRAVADVDIDAYLAALGDEDDTEQADPVMADL